MARRHRRPARLSPRARRTLLGLAMVAVLAPVAGVALGAAIEDVKECSEQVDLDVAAAPEIAPVLSEHAKHWSKTAPPTNGICVAVKVTAVDSASMATAYAEANDATVDVGNADVTDVDLPDVWVPESLTWLTRLNAVVDGLFDERVDSVAESPVGLAVSQQTASDNQMTTLNDITVDAKDPRSNAASLALLMTGVTNDNVTLHIDSSGEPLMSQAAVTAYNAEHADDPVVFLEAQPSLPRFDYPFMTPASADKSQTGAADAFRSSLLSAGFTDRLGQRGLTVAGPYPQPPDADTVKAALDSWG